MSELVRERIVVSCDRDSIWAVIRDPAALARVLPGCESLEIADDGSLRGVLSTRLQFLTLRADVVASILDLDPPHSMTLDLDGRPRHIAGSFRASIPFELEPVTEATTAVTYRVELSVSGRLASFGAPLLRDTMRRQVAALVANLEREVAAQGSSGEPKGA